MGIIAILKKQHGSLLETSGQILSAVQAETTPDNATQIKSSVLRLIDGLASHITVEDEHVYPILGRHYDEKIRHNARQLHTEMGDLVRTLDSYGTQWLSGDAVAAHPDAFTRATLELVAHLGQRIAREETELFGPLEKLSEAATLQTQLQLLQTTVEGLGARLVLVESELEDVKRERAELEQALGEQTANSSAVSAAAKAQSREVLAALAERVKGIAKDCELPDADGGA